MDWDTLVASGVVEYVDVEEEETIMCSMTPEDLAEARRAPCKRTPPNTLIVKFIHQ